MLLLQVSRLHGTTFYSCSGPGFSLGWGADVSPLISRNETPDANLIISKILNRDFTVSVDAFM